MRFKMAHKTPDDPIIPFEVEHVWEWFWALSARRRKGPELLTYSEVGEWSRLTGNAISFDEIEMIMSMDSAWMKETISAMELFEQRQAHNQSSKKPKDKAQ